MKQFVQRFCIVMWGVAVLLPGMPVRAANLDIPQMVITEMSPGTTASASQEFIELYNQTTESIDLGAQGWQLQIATSKAATWDKPKIVTLQGVVHPGAYYLIASTHILPGESKSYLQEYAGAQFTSGLTTSSGHIRLVRNVDGTQQVVDQLEWTTVDDGQPTSPSIDDMPPKMLEGSLAIGSSLKRLTQDGVFVHTGDGSVDFITSLCPSPTAYNASPQPLPMDAPVPTSIDVANPTCVATEIPVEEPPLLVGGEEPPATLLPPEPEVSNTLLTPKIPTGNLGLVVPQLTELLPNPGKPQTDGQDEFVELYNPNATSYDLSGYILASGKKQYVFPTGTSLPSKQFVAFFSSDTKLSLANNGGSVRLLDPFGREIGSTETYGAAKDGQAWARANGTWQWTLRPTPNAANAISPPPKSKKAAVKKPAAGLASANLAKKPSKQSDQLATTAADIEQSPGGIHPLALAVVGGFALLYGAYEYRRDLANRLYQFRSYRTTRRETRQAVEGR